MWYGPPDTPKGVGGRRADRSPAAADFPRVVCWTVSRYYTV